MVDKHRLQQTINDLEASHTILGAIVSSRGPDWRSELVQARRVLAEALTQFANSLNQNELAPELTADDRSGIRDRLSRFRSALAMHQASFPAVSIADGNDPTYQASARAVREAAAELFTFTRSSLKLP